MVSPVRPDVRRAPPLVSFSARRNRIGRLPRSTWISLVLFVGLAALNVDVGRALLSSGLAAANALEARLAAAPVPSLGSLPYVSMMATGVAAVVMVPLTFSPVSAVPLSGMPVDWAGL